MNVGRYYLNRQNYVGAINRFKTVVAEYQTTAQVEEALYRICEANMTLGIVPEAQAAAAVLGHNFPNSDWYKRSYALLKSGGVSPSIAGDSWFTKTLKALTPGAKKQPEVRAEGAGPRPAAARRHAGAQGRRADGQADRTDGRPTAERTASGGNAASRRTGQFSASAGAISPA